MKKKIIRVTTVPVSLLVLLKGQLKFIDKYFSVIAVSSPGKELLEVEEREGVKTHEVKMTRTISPLSDFLSIYRLYQLFKAERPFIVHSHTPKAGFVSMIAAYFAGVPNRLHTVAGLPLMETTGLKREILLYAERLTYFCSTLVLPNSTGLNEFITRQNLTRKNKLMVIGDGSSNGIDLTYFRKSNDEIIAEELKEELKIKDRFVFVFVGRIVSHKGINELVSAFIRLNSEIFQTVLLLVGNFESDLDPVSEETRANMDHPSIRYIGYQNDIRKFLEISDVFVFPSYREGFPNVVLQACAYNLPCIVTDINGCNEIIVDKENGLLVKPKDENDLYRAMKLIYEDSILRNFMGKNNRSMIEKRYDQGIIWGKILDLYKNL